MLSIVAAVALLVLWIHFLAWAFDPVTRYRLGSWWLYRQQVRRYGPAGPTDPRTYRNLAEARRDGGR